MALLFFSDRIGEKMRSIKFFASLILLSCFKVMAFADDTPATTSNQVAPYIQASIGVNVHTPKSSLFPSLPISMWVGHKFVFLPMEKELQYHGYHFTPGDQVITSSTRLPYNDFVGRVGKVINVTKNGPCWDVTLEMVDDGEHYTQTAYGDTLDELAPVEDIDMARQLWKGNTLWLIHGDLSTYDAQTGVYGYFTINNYHPVSVIDIVASSNWEAPIRFICKAENGRIGYIDVHLSNTNVDKIAWGDNHFADAFLISNPRKIYPWGDKIWNAIENNEAISGMTQLQVKMALGGNPPKIVYKHTPAGLVARWCGYNDKNSFLIFLNDKLQIPK